MRCSRQFKTNNDDHAFLPFRSNIFWYEKKNYLKNGFNRFSYSTLSAIAQNQIGPCAKRHQTINSITMMHSTEREPIGKGAIDEIQLLRCLIVRNFRTLCSIVLSRSVLSLLLSPSLSLTHSLFSLFQ